MDCNLNNDVFAKPTWVEPLALEAQLEWERKLAAGEVIRPTSTTQTSTASLKCSQCKKDTTAIYHTPGGDLCLECYTKMREKQDSYFLYTMPTPMDKMATALERIAYALETEFEINTDPVTTFSSHGDTQQPAQWKSFSEMMMEHCGHDDVKSAPDTVPIQLIDNKKKLN